MAFRAMDAGCGGTDTFDTAECPDPVTVIGLYVASTGTVWQAFACDAHAHQLLAPRPLLTRDRETLRRRQQLAEDPRIGRRYAGEREGPIARGAQATALVRRAVEWGKRHPLRPVRPVVTPDPRVEPARITLDELAGQLAVDPGDVRVLLSWLDPEGGGRHPDGTLLAEYAAAVRDQIDHLSERTTPEYWWPGSDPEAGWGATKMR